MASLWVQTTSRLRASATRAFSVSQRAAYSKMTMIGRLGAAPEKVTMASGRQVWRYSVRTGRGNEPESWWRVVCFADQRGVGIMPALMKGSLVYIEASARQRRFERPDGSSASNVDIVQVRLDLLSQPRAKGNGQQQVEESTEGSAEGDESVGEAADQEAVPETK